MARAEHTDQVHAYLGRAARNSRWVLLASLLAVLLFIGGGMARSDSMVTAGLLVIGAGIVLFPYGTPDSVRRLGARRATRLARVIGLVFTVVGAVAAAFALVRA